MLQRQDANSWELSLPQNVIYVPQDAAVRVLAHQLAMLTETDNSLAGARQKSQLAQMLAALLVE
jgi:hypothetical protein